MSPPIAQDKQLVKLCITSRYIVPAQGQILAKVFLSWPEGDHYCGYVIDTIISVLLYLCMIAHTSTPYGKALEQVVCLCVFLKEAYSETTFFNLLIYLKGRLDRQFCWFQLSLNSSLVRLSWFNTT